MTKGKVYTVSMDIEVQMDADAAGVFLAVLRNAAKRIDFSAFDNADGILGPVKFVHMGPARFQHKGVK